MANDKTNTSATPLAKAKPKPARVLKIVLSIGALVALVVFLARNLLLGTPVQTYAATIGALRQSVVATGRVLTPQRTSLAAVVSARVQAIPVIAGQSVTKGQLLIALDDADVRARVEQALASQAQATAALERMTAVTLPEAKQILAKAKADLNQSQQQRVRIAALREQKFVSATQLDEALRNEKISLAQVQIAALQVAASSSDGTDRVALSAGLEQAKATVRIAQAGMAMYQIVAPIAGTLITRMVEPGDSVVPGKTLMVLAPIGDTEIVVQIDEKNFSKLAIGQIALASADAFADTNFSAVLVYINPGIDPVRGSVEVKLSVPEPPKCLLQDMTVSVEIETALKTSALVIPTAAVHALSELRPWVMVVRNQHTVRQPIKLGLQGDLSVEVLSGIRAGEPVILTSVGTITVGQHVRARAQEHWSASHPEGEDVPQ